MADETTPVWFITGCSTGFGRELALAALDRGWRVVATARDRARVEDIAAAGGERALTLSLDVTKPHQVAAAVREATERFGRIDALVNNAGYGYQSSIEEGDDAEIRDQFEANVFGLFAMTRAVLPGMRAAGRGAIVNVTSLAGLLGFPSSGYYAATKHAVEGFSDALAAEVGPLGLTVTCVEPGPFRTDWAGRSLHQTKSRIDAYADTAGKRMAETSGYSGQQPGDPARGARIIIDAVSGDAAPRHLVLGKMAYQAATRSLRQRLDAIEAGRERSLAADFPDGEG